MTARNLDKAVAKIKEVPPLPVAVQKLLAVVGDEASGARDVNKALSSDPALAGKILKLVNSAFYGFSGKISTITRAVVILGFSAVRNLALGFGAYETLNLLPPVFDRNAFWRHSMTVAAGAQALALRLKYEDPEEAFVTGLLHDIGHLILGLALPDQYEALVADSRRIVPSQEAEAFGIAHTETGQLLMEHWKLPDRISRVARFHHTPEVAAKDKETLVAVTTLADVVASIFGHRFIEQEEDDSFFTIARGARLPIGAFQQILPDIEKRVAATQAFLDIAAEGAVPKPMIADTTTAHPVLLLGRDRERIEWVRHVLVHFGYDVRLTPGGDETPALFLFEPGALTPAELLALAARHPGVPTRRLGIPPAPTAVEAAYAPMPLLFTADDIRQAIAEAAHA